MREALPNLIDAFAVRRGSAHMRTLIYLFDARRTMIGDGGTRLGRTNDGEETKPRLVMNNWDFDRSSTINATRRGWGKGSKSAIQLMVTKGVFVRLVSQAHQG